MSWEEDLWGAISKKSQNYGGGQLGRAVKKFQCPPKKHPLYIVQTAQKKLKNFVQNSILQFASMCDIIVSASKSAHRTQANKFLKET